MIRFCPNCASERPLTEVFCEGLIQGAQCNWFVGDEPLRDEGWRPAQPAAAVAAAVVADRSCQNGHPLSYDDLICLVCGANATATIPEPNASSPTASEAGETVIDGWRLLRQISATARIRERFLAERVEDGRSGVLTLYHHGAEPDPAVYEVLRRLPAAHIAEVLATGRWDERAYEVVEAIAGGTLQDLGIVATDVDGVRSIVAELGPALHAFAEAGLRHRDIRPATILVRSREPLDIVIAGFGSARLSEFDLDVAPPLEVSRYMAPEAIAGGVAPASDWWSLGMVLLEQITHGECFQEINERALLIHVVANGVSLPKGLDPALDVLLRGLLARDRHQRWQWEQVKAWVVGEDVPAPPSSVQDSTVTTGPELRLGDRVYRQASTFALAAADAENWSEAVQLLIRGGIVTWAQEARLSAQSLAALRQLSQHQTLEDDWRLALALKVLNPEMPLILRGDIVTPGWLLEHPLEGYDLVAGPAPDLLASLDTETWLPRLKARADGIRKRAHTLDVEVDEEALRILLLTTSRAKLSAKWEEKRRLFPDTDHPGLASIAERSMISEEDLILLLGANIGLFKSRDEIVNEAKRLALSVGLSSFDPEAAQVHAALPRSELTRLLGERTADFARTSNDGINGWADQFRVERRLDLPRAILVLAIPASAWQTPPKQQYLTQLLQFFEKRVAAAVLRGPLARMVIGKTTPRVDLHELGTERSPAAALLDHLLQRGQRALALDPTAFNRGGNAEERLQSLARHTTLYKRDTGIDGLYLGFPFLLAKDAKASTRTRITPLLLWPVQMRIEVGSRRSVSLAFDSDREEVRLNPALETLLGPETVHKWRKVADELLGRSQLRASDVMDAFGVLSPARSRDLRPLPGPTTSIPARTDELECSAVLFHVTFTGQAIGEDLRNMRAVSPLGTGLESTLRLAGVENRSSSETTSRPDERNRYLTAESDPSQESAVLLARQAPGLVIEGPPGTGKSQTIVNIVADAIGNRRSLLVVCQKHAALEVVEKRLIAEGLGGRVILVNDVNKDREVIIKAVREQVEALFRLADNPAAALRQKREGVAARVDALERELDRNHAALHHKDPTTGLSYRDLLGELIALEEQGPTLDISALRARFEKMAMAELAAIEEEVAPLVRHWLPAKFEESALSDLKAFSPDPATLADFKQTLKQFLDSERARFEVTRSKPVEFDVDDPSPYRAWLQAHSQRFLTLPDGARAQLRRWLPLFRASVNGGGHRIIEELSDIVTRLDSLTTSSHDAALSPILANDDSSLLQALIQLSALTLQPVPWWRRLSMRRFAAKRKITAYLENHGEAFSTQRIDALLKAAVLERHWRPLRQALGDINQRLGLSPVDKKAGLALQRDARATFAALTSVQELAGILAIAPEPERLDSAASLGTKSAVLNLFTALEAAFTRHEARAASFASLDQLSEWVGAGWCEAARGAIANNQSNQTRLAAIIKALPSLGAYQAFRSRASRLSAGGSAVLRSMRTKEAGLLAIPSERLEAETRRILAREARLAWKQRLELADPDLLLERADIASKVKTLARLDAEMRNLNRHILRDDVDLASIAKRGDWEDITRLTGPRSRRLREFFDRGSSLGLLKLRPIWLMNPDVASRVLPLRPGLFDAVVFDEASQMPVEHSLPALLRARVTIVSGDEKQMPPTAFFSSKVESDEAEAFDGETPDSDASDDERETYDETWNRREIKDCPDLLQLARSTLPTSTLQIHYRSAYRELIGYSNASFYGGNLSVPVRHPAATVQRVRPIETIAVNGVYSDQSNEAEAIRVVEVLADLWKAAKAKRPSVGVVTFNRKQADLIEDHLEARAEKDAAFREAYRAELERVDDGEDMGIFVKNVENVQGDERDVIVFSSTFGRSDKGIFRRTFGVLGQRGGERRLNVAVTRARQKIVMVTSMPIADVSDFLNTHRPPSTPRDYLQGYLEYARMVSAGETESAGLLLQRMNPREGPPRAQARRHGDDGFINAVAEYVTGLGYSVSAHSDSDAFGLDLAIEDPATGQFAVGIECDAPRHELLRHARAREVWRSRVLRQSIKRVHRVSSHAWYHSQETEKDELRKSIEASLNREQAA